MNRIKPVAADLREPAPIVQAIRARRGGTLLNLDRMLLHSPPLAAGWNGFLRAVRTELALDPRLRELAICAVASLNGAEYEFHHHAPEFLAAGGSAAQLAALRAPDQEAVSASFSETERAVLLLTIESTRAVAISESTFNEVRAKLGERKTVELVAVVAAYNMVSRFLVALEIEPE